MARIRIDLDDEYGLPQSTWENTRESLRRTTAPRAIKASRLGGKRGKVRRIKRSGW